MPPLLPASPRILISGIGIAGASFACNILRAYPSARITMLERAPALRLTGASVDIRSNAVDIIEWMGVKEAILGCTTKEEGIQFLHPSGSSAATLLASGRSDMQTITSEFEIFRGELARIFLSPLQNDERVEMVFNETVSSFSQSSSASSSSDDDGDDDGGVTVTFSSGKRPAERYDLLVAADGMGSKIRGLMLGTAPREQIFDEGVHVAYWTTPFDLLHGSKLAQWYNAPLGRVIFLRPDPDPRGRTRAHFMNVTTRDDVGMEMKRRLNEALAEGNESYKDLMEELFADAGWLAPEVIKSMRASEDFYCSLFGQVRSAKLQDGRVVLLGDAGYATPGMGTSLAIMGSYILAGELLQSGGDVGKALERYEELMMPFVRGQQGDFQAMQYLNPQTPWGIGVRNVLLGLLTGLKVDRMGMWVAAKLGFSEAKMVLPRYPWPEAK